MKAERLGSLRQPKAEQENQLKQKPQLSTEAHIVLDAISGSAMTEIIKWRTGLSREEIVLAGKEIRHALGREV